MSELRHPNINTNIISGRLTRDPELNFIPNGTAVVNFSIAHDNNYLKNGEWQKDTSFFDVVYWGERGEKFAQQSRKGVSVVVEGSLKSRTYKNKEDQNVKVIEIVAHKVYILEKSEQKNNETNSHSEPPIEDDTPFK